MFAELRRRLKRRNADDAAAIARRLRDARAEVTAFGEFDYVVINDVLERAAEELRSIILAARCRPAARAVEIERILRSFAPRGGAPRRKGGGRS